MEKQKYKKTELDVNGVKVTIYDPSSNEERRKRLEESCVEFINAVKKQQKEKELAATSSTKQK